MKERPILFSGPMVRAILDGRKTQTRRIVKSSIADFHMMDFMHLENDGSPEIAWFESGRVQEWVKCPYGQVGDRLWVRETWAVGRPMDHKSPSRMHRKVRSIWYAVDGNRPDWAGKTRVSIHMPRWASRIALEVTGVRVERLNEISEQDAIAEGFSRDCPQVVRYQCNGPMSYHFAALWESINGKDSWAANPWVWVIEFARVK